jgi:hypothetical protein
MKKMLFTFACLASALALTLTLAYAEDGEILEGHDASALTCNIYDEFMNPITSANRGDVVQLGIQHETITNPTQNFIFIVPSSNPDYKDLFYYSRRSSGTSTGALIFMKINPWTYIDGTGYFIGRVPGQGACYKALTIE